MARVLIVDDEATDLLLMKSVVEESGHEVFVASDGEEAFKVHLRKGVQIVVTDLHMPGVDGIEFIEALQALYPEVRIIVVSGKDQDSLDKARVKGAFMAFSKPVDPHELAQAVARATLL